MLEAIIIKLVASLTGYLFEGFLDSTKSINVEGAPSWYGKDLGDKNLYSYGYSKGGMESIEISKDNCRVAMIKKIDGLIEVVVYDNFRNISDPNEVELINKFKTDSNTGVFVTKNMKFDKIEHFEEQKDSLQSKYRPAQTFAGGMIPKQVVLDYQKERLQKIKYEITHFRRKNLENELEAETAK